MEKINIIRIFFFLGITVSILVACGQDLGATISSPTATIANEDTFMTATLIPSELVPTPTSNHTSGITSTLPQTLNATYQTWHATAVAVQSTEKALSDQAWNNESTQIAEFSVECEDLNFYSSEISRDGKWFASSCGYKSDQTLIVQNKQGIKWVLDFKGFLSPDSPDGIPGALSPKFWGPDGKYLYFTSQLGYEGGGDDCFPNTRGDYGLFRINLKTGSWATIISPTDSFPGYEIEFSSTGRRYAATINGVMITDLNNGDVTTIAASGVVEGLSWSPDGLHLAYSVASCGEQSVQSSSVYVWDASTNQTQMLFTLTDATILRSESWIDNATLRIEGEKIVAPDVFYNIYLYDITQNGLLFTGTATPEP